MEINHRIFRASGANGNTLAVRGVSPQAVAKLANSINLTGLRNLGNISARRRWLPVSKQDFDGYLYDHGAAYVKTIDFGPSTDDYYILVLDIFDGNHRFHATSQLIANGTRSASDTYFQTAVYDERLPDVVAELTGRLLNEYVRFLV